MPSLETLSMTPKQRRELIQVFAALNLTNEIVFFLAVQEYKKIPTDQKAIVIHNTFLMNHANSERVAPSLGHTDISFINIPLTAYTTQFRQRYEAIEARVLGQQMKKFKRGLGKRHPKRGVIIIPQKKSGFSFPSLFPKKPPKNLFDSFITPLETHILVTPTLLKYNELLVEDSQATLYSWAFGKGGRTQNIEGEILQFTNLFHWSEKVSLSLCFAFDVSALGIKDVFVKHLPSLEQRPYLMFWKGDYFPGAGLADRKYIFPNFRETLMAFLDYSNDTTVGVEENLSFDEELVRQEDVSIIEEFGPPIRGTIPVRLPTLKTPYQRNFLGVCKAFYSDLSGLNITIDSEDIDPEISGVKRLLEKLGNDEAMLMLVSQLVCQGGIPLIVEYLFSYRTLANKNSMKRKYLLFNATTGKYIHPTTTTGYTSNITTHRDGRVEIDIELVPRNAMISEDKGENFELGTFDDAGIQSLEITFQAMFKRYGNEIRMELAEVNIRLRAKDE